VKYIDVPIRHWKLIAIITGTAVVVAALVSFLSPPVYEATSSVIITKVRSDLVLEPQYKTAAKADSASMRLGHCLDRLPNCCVQDDGDDIAAQGQDDVVKVARVAAEPSASATSAC